MSIYGHSTTPFPPPSPIGSPNVLPQTMSPAPGGQVHVQPGAITYTTTTSPDGRAIYHPFKAVPASYQTPNGVVTGIQWIPAEATHIIPAGATPATSDFASSWSRGGHGSREDERALREWQKDEDKRRRREEKEASKRLERERREREDKELRRARDRDARGSRNYGAPPTGSPYGGYGVPASAMSDLERRFENTDITRGPYDRDRRQSVNYGSGRSRKGSVGEYDQRRKSVYNDPTTAGFTAAGYPAGHRPASPYNPGGILPPPSPIRDASNPGYAPAAGYNTSPFPPSPGRPADPYQRSASPFQRSSSPYYGPPGGIPGAYSAGSHDGPMLSRSRAASPIPGTVPYARSRAASPIPGGGAYPRSRAASPIPGGVAYARSRAASPIPGASPYNAAPGFPQATVPGRAPPSPRPSPRMVGGALGYPIEPTQMLSTPEGFGRPPNLAQSYTWFDTMKIQDMDDFLDIMPRMPLVLVPHDVYHEDWIRFMQDIALAWAGKLPTADAGGGRSPKRSRMTADLIELWNGSFFQQRGVEVVLYKGRERRSGPAIGTLDANLPGFNEYDDDSSSGSSDLSDDSDLSEDDRYGRGGPYGAYGRTNDIYSQELRESKRRQRERKAEKKRRQKEKKARRRAREKQKTYALYLTCITPREGVPQY